MTAERWIVVLAGGHGTRFWPLSTRARPKQLLPLVGPAPMLRETLDRTAPVAPAVRTLILTSASLLEGVGAVAPEIPRANILVEPRPAGTAAALAWAAREIGVRAGREAVMISLHADWAVADVPAFRAALGGAADVAAREHALVTVGIVPTRAEPGLGYIEPGPEVSAGVRRVARFVEKPDIDTARALGERGGLWNSGIFAWCVGDLLDEIAAVCPEVAPALAAHGGDAASAEAFFAAAKPVAIDVGVLERSKRALVLAGTFGWSDVGTWSALLEVRELDAQGNAVSGPVHLHDARGNVVHAEGATAVLYGVEDLVVVALDGITMVTTVARARDLKALLDALPPEVRDR